MFKSSSQILSVKVTCSYMLSRWWIHKCTSFYAILDMHCTTPKSKACTISRNSACAMFNIVNHATYVDSECAISFDSPCLFGRNCTTIPVSCFNCHFCAPLFSQVLLSLSQLLFFLAFDLTSVVFTLSSLWHVSLLLFLIVASATFNYFHSCMYLTYAHH